MDKKVAEMELLREHIKEKNYHDLSEVETDINGELCFTIFTSRDCDIVTVYRDRFEVADKNLHNFLTEYFNNK